jgi:hypothetical protein
MIDEDVKLLMTIPRHRILHSALLIKSEIGAIERFPSGEREKLFARMQGSFPRLGHLEVEQSSYGPITKQSKAEFKMARVDHG